MVITGNFPKKNYVGSFLLPLLLNLLGSLRDPGRGRWRALLAPLPLPAPSSLRILVPNEAASLRSFAYRA